MPRLGGSQKNKEYFSLRPHRENRDMALNPYAHDDHSVGSSDGMHCGLTHPSETSAGLDSDSSKSIPRDSHAIREERVHRDGQKQTSPQRLTCFYWFNQGKCLKGDDECV